LDLKKPFIPNNGVSHKKPFDFMPMAYDNYQSQVHGQWSNEYLSWRFCELPQSEYHYFSLSTLSCLVRTGHRGKLKEVQILFLNSTESLVRRDDFRCLRRRLEKDLQPDIIGFPMSADYPLFQQMSSFGFLKFNSGTNFVFKFLDDSCHDDRLK